MSPPLLHARDVRVTFGGVKAADGVDTHLGMAELVAGRGRSVQSFLYVFVDTFGDGYVEVPVEIWTYNFGPYKLLRRVRFVDGKVDEIETLGYGYREKSE